jgi:hypothetical protein
LRNGGNKVGGQTIARGEVGEKERLCLGTGGHEQQSTYTPKIPGRFAGHIILLHLKITALAFKGEMA